MEAKNLALCKIHSSRECLSLCQQLFSFLTKDEISLSNFLIKFLIGSLGISYHIFQFYSFPSHSKSTLHPVIPPQPPRKNKTKQNNKTRQIINEQTNNKTSHSSVLSTSTSHFFFVIMNLGAAMCHTGYPFAQTTLLATVQCNELLVWFNASGFQYNTGLSLKLPSDIPPVALSHGEPRAMVLPDRFLPLLQWSQMGEMLGRVNSNWILTWVVAGWVSLGLYQYCPHQTVRKQEEQVGRRYGRKGKMEECREKKIN